MAARFRARALFEAAAWAESARALGPLVVDGTATDDDRGRIALAALLGGEREVAAAALGADPQALRVQDRSALFAYAAGHLCRIAGLKTQAELAFARAAEASNDSADALYWRGHALSSLGRWDEAATVLGQVPAQGPGTLHALAARALLGEALAKLQRMTESRMITDGYTVSVREFGSPSLADEALVLGPLTTPDDPPPSSVPAEGDARWRFEVLDERGADVVDIDVAQLGDTDAPLEVLFTSGGKLRAWQPGTPASREILRWPRTIGAARGLAVADFDGDARADLWLVGARAQSLALAGRPPVDVLKAGGTDAVPWDLDRDGDLDVVVPRSGGVALARDVGGGDAAFGDASIGAGLTASSPRVVYLPFDVDGDLRDDLVAVGGGPLLLLRAYRHAAFLPHPTPPELAALGAPTHASVVDVDADGRDDLVVAGPEGVRWARNRGAWRFASPQKVGAAAAAAVWPADVDSDPLPELWALSNEGALTLYDQRATEWVASAVPTPEPIRTMRVTDLDRDGLSDLVAVGARHVLIGLRADEPRWQVALDLRVDGGGRNRDAVGARLEVVAGQSVWSRTMRVAGMTLAVPAGSTPATVRVTWPSAEVQTTSAPRATTGQQRIDLRAAPLAADGPKLALLGEGATPEVAQGALEGRALGMPERGGARPLPAAVVPVLFEGVSGARATLTFEVASGPRDLVYLDGLEVASVPHGADVALVATAEGVRAYEGVEPLEGAQDARGGDVLDLLSEVGDGRVASQPTPGRPGAAAPFTLELALGPLDPADSARLIVDARVVPPTSTTRYAYAYDPIGLEPLMRLDGRATTLPWQEVVRDAPLPLASGSARSMTPLTSAPRGDEVSLKWTGRRHIEVDAVRLAFDDGAPAPVGASLTMRDAALMADTPAPGAATVSRLARIGALSPLGDVLERVRVEDDQWVVFGPNERLRVTFETKESGKGAAQTWVAWVRGFRKELDVHAAASQTVGPMPWRDLDAYPRGPEASARTQASDAARTRPAPPLLPDPRVMALDARE
jgi:hypothetical protein